MTDQKTPDSAVNVNILVSRDSNARFLRKWEITAYHADDKGARTLLDRRRMFGGPFFKRRLKRHIRRIQEMQGRVLEVLSDLSSGKNS